MSSPAQAAVGINEQINYQGRLLNSAGATVPDGTYNMRFKIYQDGAGCEVSGTSPCGGTLKWTELRESTNMVTVKNGYFSVQLGSVTAFGTSIDWNQDTLWLSVDIGGTGTPSYDGEMLPFRRLTATPYALNAKQLNGLDATKFLQIAPSAVQIDSSTLSSINLNKTGASGNIMTLQQNGTNVFVVDNSGNLALGNVTPTAAIQIDKGTATASNIKFTAGTTTNQSATDGFDVGITGTGIALLNQREGFSMNFNTNNAQRMSISATGDITIGTADATGSLLVVDTKTTTGDPTGSNGGIYYNSNANKFRCFQNSAWVDCIASSATATLQAGYDNSNSPATILTSATTKGILFKSGATFNAASAFEVQDSGGTAKFSVDTSTGFVTASTGIITPVINAQAGGAPATIGRTTRIAEATPTGGTNFGTGNFTTTTTFTPAANTVLVTFIGMTQACQTSPQMAADGSDIAVSGGGLTWVPIYGLTVTTTSPCQSGMRAFYAIVGGSPPSNMSITVGASGFPAVNWNVFTQEFTNVNTASPVAGAVTGSRTTATNDTFTSTLGATPATGDVILSFANLDFQDPGTNSNSGYATPSGWTQLSVTSTAPNPGSSSQLLTATGTTSTTLNWAMATLNHTPQKQMFAGFVLKQASSSAGTVTLGASGTNNVMFGSNVLNADITNGLVQVGSATTDATAVEFVLDSYSVASDPTAVDGAMYYNTSSKSFRCAMNGRWRGCVSGVLFANTSVPAAVANTATETNFASTYTIPANDCQPGRVYRITAQGVYGTTTVAPTLTIRFKLGTTNVIATAANTTTISLTNREWRADGQIICDTTGTTGTVEGQGIFTRFTSATAGVLWEMVNTATVTINTTTTQTVAVSAQWGTANAANTITLRQLIVEASGP